MNFMRDANFFLELEKKYGANNYFPIPVVIEKGKGVYLWDVEGKKYYDFLSSYSTVNQGHSHPRIINTLIEQSKKITLTSRAFFNNVLGEYEKFVCELLGYDKLLPMNTGAEGVETAIKISRKWGYDEKKIPEGKAKIVFAEGNFHGRTVTVISASTDIHARKGFGPFTEGIVKIPYNNIESLRSLLKKDRDIASFIVEPIQGEAGILIPSDEYLKEAYELCKENNVLFVADEIQTGLGRTGKMLAMDYIGVKPDILILGKALSGGVYPVSAVLADDNIMKVMTPGIHGSTYGGNPLGSKVAITALQVLIEENLIDNAYVMGNLFRSLVQEKIVEKYPNIVESVRGKGLLNAIVINNSNNKKKAWDLCIKFKDNGLLAKPTHDNVIRLAPPLIINQKEIIDSVNIIEKSVQGIL